mgnify:CR=1 FL=1
MQYKIHSVRVKNFKCFDNSKFYEFELDEERSPVILTGPNGFGKTTFFDALELLFSNKITRFDTKIESKATNLQKNVLLNRAEVDGYIVATLVNSNKDYLSVFARIDHSMRKVSYDVSVEFGFKDEYISTDELTGYLKEYHSWKASMSEFNILKYSPENFDVYYYVSQAESVHFLKKTIAERKDAMNALLDLERVSDWQTHIQSRLIGSKNNTPNVVINDEQKTVKENITKDIVELKKHISDEHTIGNKEYFSLLSSGSDINIPYWDMENLDRNSAEDLQKGIYEVERLSSYAKNQDDYNKYLWNMRIESSLQSGIDDIILIIPYIKDNSVDIDAINSFISEKNLTIEIYNRSTFLRTNEADTAIFNISNIERIKELNPQLITFDVQKVSSLCNQIIMLNKGLTTKQSILLNLENARVALKRVKNDYDSESADCPYCGYQYENIDTLNRAFSMTKDMLEAEAGETLSSIKNLKAKLEYLLHDSRNAVKQKLADMNEEMAKNTLETISLLTEFIGDKNRISNANFIYSLIAREIGWKELDRSEKKLEIRRICLLQKKQYNDALFIENLNKYTYASIQADYPGIILKEQKLLFNENAIKNKILYIKATIEVKLNNDVIIIKERLKQNLIRDHKLKKLRENFDKLGKLYADATDSYKNQVLEKLRVPLLIYTGKILQDYQNGLGVFISKDEMRFVTNGDIKHDILNTFSSGQLSGFVLAFLFSMNKQYIKESEDDLAFLLIDDPVQTMDDINISSMIEVLRNDFSDKQIIISTHEMDKENYILYKFFKYNKIGQSFNVKDRLYGV